MTTQRLSALRVPFLHTNKRAIQTVSSKLSQIGTLLISGLSKLLFPVINPFYVHRLSTLFTEVIFEIPGDEQCFLLTRSDMDGISINLHYAALWQKQRSKASIFLLSYDLKTVMSLAKIICPEVNLIYKSSRLDTWMRKTFSEQKLYDHCYSRVYAYLLTLRPSTITLLNFPKDKSTSNYPITYQPLFDKRTIGLNSQSKEFQKAYYNYNYYLNPRSWEDFNRLIQISPPFPPPKNIQESTQALRKIFSLKRPYIVLDTENLFSKTRQKANQSNYYDIIIDLLIERDFAVILMGKAKQTILKDRAHLIKYSQSPLSSLENDHALISKASGVISSKTVSEKMSALYHSPLLGLNYTAPTTMIHHPKHRYLFKKVWDNKKKKHLNWAESLTHPTFFDCAQYHFRKHFKYHEHEEETYSLAVLEFLDLIDKPISVWQNLAPKQKKFKALLKPEHMDLFTCPGVPPDSSLDL